MVERQRKAAHTEEKATSQQNDLKIAISDAATTQGMLAATRARRGKERILASNIWRECGRADLEFGPVILILGYDFQIYENKLLLF